MVFSRLASLKHLVLALITLGLCVAGLELALHLYEACAASGGTGARSACAPSWKVHHLFKPDVRVITTNPDTGREVAWRTNSLGLRGPEIEVPKPAGKYRVLCLGGDSTLGAETATGETFCDRLQKTLQAASPMEIEVLNAGCPQYGPLLSFLLLKHDLLSVSPDLVICNFDMSDIANDHRCRRYARMNGQQPLYCPHPDLEWQRTAAERMWVERLLMWRHGQRGLGYIVGREDEPEDVRDIDSQKGTYAWIRDDAPDWSVYVQQTLSVIAQTAELCRKSQCEFVLAVVPCPWQISADASNGPGVRSQVGLQEHVVYANRAPRDAVTAFARKERIAVCDAAQVFGRIPRPERLFLKNAPHFSATGHDLYARIVGGYLLQKFDGPWRGASPSGVRPERRLSDRQPVFRQSPRVEPVEFRREQAPTMSQGSIQSDPPQGAALQPDAPKSAASQPAVPPGAAIQPAAPPGAAIQHSVDNAFDPGMPQRGDIR